MIKPGIVVVGIALTACALQGPIKKALTGDEFIAAFKRDCANITGIEELHSFTWYTVNGTYEGVYTNESFSLVEMSSWLEDCGRNPEEVSQILE